MPNKRSKRNKSGKGGGNHPPMLRPQYSGSKTIRFQSSNTVAAVLVTAQNLLQLTVVALTSTATSRLWSSVRLRKVEAWCIGAQNAASEKLSIVGVGAGPQNFVADLSMGVQPAHVVWRPSAASLASFWYEQGVRETDNLFQISAPASTVIDVSVDWIMDTASGFIAGPVPAGATAGDIYCATLDGNGVTGVIVPQDYTPVP